MKMVDWKFVFKIMDVIENSIKNNKLGFSQKRELSFAFFIFSLKCKHLSIIREVIWFWPK